MNRRDPPRRQMVRTDIKVCVEMIEKAFVQEWNRLVEKETDSLNGDANPLVKYRDQELRMLLCETGKIEEVQTDLARRTLERIEIWE